MDYLGWELERQRSALAALLLGGEAARDRARRNPAGLGTVRGSASGRYAGGLGHVGDIGDGPLGAWETVRKAGTSRLADTQESPASAWEAILAADVALRGKGRDAEAGVPAGLGAAWREGTDPLSGGTGAQAEFPPPSGSCEARRMEWETTAGDTAENTAEAAETARRKRAGEQFAGRAYRGRGTAWAALSEMGSGGGETAGLPGQGPDPLLGGLRPQGGLAGRTHPASWSGSALRGGGDGAGTPGQDGLPVFRETGEAGGTGPWRSGEAAALRAEDSARALSRAVQRDARRYDGGFHIY